LKYWHKRLKLERANLVDQAGAEPHPTLSPAHIILGIKETPLDELLRLPVLNIHNDFIQEFPRTHIMFSHTVKGQTYNMPLLSRFLNPGWLNSAPKTKKDLLRASKYPTLIDYELLLNDEGKRAVGFGWFAGGMCVLCITELFSNGANTLTIIISCGSARGTGFYIDYAP